MTEIIRNRTIRPSSRLEKSKSYKIDTKKVSAGDILIVNIDHESENLSKTYKFIGDDMATKNSISFRVNDYGTSIDISWIGAQPINSSGSSTKIENKIKPKKTKSKKTEIIIGQTNLKISFEPISNSEITVLILGTAPGDKSLELGEYYGHPRNRFWKIISTLTENDLPISYSDKKSLLQCTKIGIWDVAHKVIRKGSLDNAIKSEEPNDLDNFIEEHKDLKIIGFNGKKAEELFNKYFNIKDNLIYISLPSTSPANTGFDFDEICKEWRIIFE